MRVWLYIVIAVCLIGGACAVTSTVPRDLSTTANVFEDKTPQPYTLLTAEKILENYTVKFAIPNPLAGGGSGTSVRRTDPSHESVILCKAVLLDDYSTEADILAQCYKDSLDKSACADCKVAYVRNNVRKDMFRIRISMESGFSDKSMDPSYWAIYLEDTEGVMIEPKDIVTSPIVSTHDSLFSDDRRYNLPRHLMRRDLTLYFNRHTFFGEDLLGEANPYLVLGFSRDQKTVARVGWHTREESNKKAVDCKQKQSGK